MHKYSRNMDGSENNWQYPTEEEIIDPYLNNETTYHEDYSVGVPPDDQGRHHDNNFYPSQEEQELGQRGRHSQEWDLKHQDDVMDQNPHSLEAFNLVVTPSGRPNSFDPRRLLSQTSEIDKEGEHTGDEGGALQPPLRLELAGVGRHGSVYYRAPAPGLRDTAPGRPARRNGALHRSSSTHRRPRTPEERNEKASHPTDQVEPADHGHRDHPPPGQGKLDQGRASEASLYGVNRQPREEAPVSTVGNASINRSLAAKPTRMAHSLAGQAAGSEHLPSVPRTLQPEHAQSPQAAAQAVPGSTSMGRQVLTSISPQSKRDFHPQGQNSPAPGSHESPPLQEHRAAVHRLTPQGPLQPGLHPQHQGQKNSMPSDRLKSPQSTPLPMQQHTAVAHDPTIHSQRVHPSAPVPSQSHYPTDLPSSQVRQSTVPQPGMPQSTPYGQQRPQMVPSQHAADPHRRAAQQPRQDRPLAVMPSENDQHLSHKPVPQARPLPQSSSARTQERAVQRPPGGQASYQQDGTNQPQQQLRQRPDSHVQQGVPSAAPHDKSLHPQGTQQPQQSVSGNSSIAQMRNQQGRAQQAHPSPPHEMTPSAPSSNPKAPAPPPRSKQGNPPLRQAYNAMKPVMSPQQKQRGPTEPHQRQQNPTRSPPPPTPAAMSPSSQQRPLAPAQAPAPLAKEPLTNIQPPSPSSNSTTKRPPAQIRPRPRSTDVRPRQTTPSAPILTGESLLSTLMRGRPVPRLDVRNPEHGRALVQGSYTTSPCYFAHATDKSKMTVLTRYVAQ